MILKKMFKVAGVTAMAVAMSMCMMATSFAATPATTDTATIEVTNVEHGATVRAYKIVHANYNSKGLQGYEMEANCPAIADLEHPTLTEVDAIVASINNLGDTFDPTAVTMTDVTSPDSAQVGSGSCNYRSAALPAGMYVVLVRGTNENIYNPMVISVGYNSQSQLVAGTLNGQGNFEVNGAVVQAKHTTVTADKKIVNKGTAQGSANTGAGHGDTVNVGDTVKYQITSTVPAYDKSAYSELTYQVKDTLSAGQTNKQDLVVKKSGSATPLASPADYSVAYNGQVMTITFTPTFILANPGATLTMDYGATITDAIGKDFNANPNNMELTYSNDPNDKTKSEKITDETDVYSFDFKATKVDSVNANTKLSGATFKLTGGSIPAAGLTCTTGADGLISFSGLDVGTYTMVETNAPNGYYSNDKTYTVTIAAALGTEQATDSSAYSNGVIAKTNTGKGLNNYTVTINDGTTDIGTVTYTANPTATNQSVANITNTKFQNLPSTGGTGTTVLTLAGVIGVIAITVFMMRKRRDEEA